MSEVRSLAASLDVMPPQVLIEAVVVEMSLDGNTDMGIQWKWSNPNNTSTDANSGSIGLGNIAGQLGVKYSLLTSGLEATVSALAGKSNMNVISTPRILAANDTPATINIVTQIPYIQSERTEGTGASKTVTNTWAFKDVGVTLEVTPRIGESGKVYLDLYQTTDSFTQDTMSGKPIINTRETQSTMVVQDGQTLVMGGLIRDNQSMAIQKVPILGDLPIIGHFFRTDKSVNSKTELVVFVRPTIVRTQAEANALTQRESVRIESETLQKAGVVNK
jgi:general secretion pathway protein D